MTRAPQEKTAGGPLHVAFILPASARGGVKRVILTLASILLERGHRVDLLLATHGQLGWSRPNPPSRWDNAPAGARLFRPNHDESRSPETIWRITRDGHTSTDARAHITAPSAARLPRDLLKLALAPGSDWRMCANYLFDRAHLRTQTQAIARYMEVEQPDFLVANSPYPILTSLLARRVADRPPPVVPIIHNTMEFQHTPRQKEIARRLFPTADRIVTVSHGVEDGIRTLGRRAADRITTIYNPIQPAVIAARASEPPPHPWLADGGPPVILGAGRLGSQKNFPALVRAFARVTRERPCRLLILGNGPHHPELEESARQLGVETSLALPGWVDNPYAAMARAAVFVSPSRYEGLGMALIEALACGCPVVSTDCPAGPSEILDGGRYGELVPMDDDAGLADAILRTLKKEEQADPEQRRQRREERKRRADVFDAEGVADRYLDLFAEMASGKNIAQGGDAWR